MATTDPLEGIDTDAYEPPAADAGVQDSPVTATDIREDLPQVDTQIDTGALSQPLQPPTDIDPANIADYSEPLAPEQSVESRLTGLLSRNSDYMQRAEGRATQIANRRGMMNTSLAAGMGAGAAIDAALPIAQQDAGTAAQNARLQTGLDQDTNIFNATEINRRNFAVLSADLQGQLKGIDNQLAMNMIELGKTYDIMQNLDSVNGAIYQQLTSEIGAIIQNTSDPAEAQARIDMLIQATAAELEFSTGQSLTPTPGEVPVEVPGGDITTSPPMFTGGGDSGSGPA